MSVPFKYFYDFPIPVSGDVGRFRKASQHIPQQGEIMISSFPRSGTTLLQHIVFLLLRGGTPAEDVAEVLEAIPFPEQDGFPEGEQPLAIKFHLPFRFIPFSKDARYIYIARNPKDVCVSYYHFLKDLPGYSIKSFDEFFEAFLSGQLPHGDILEHILEWYKASCSNPNVFFITYESLVKKKEKTVKDLAKFLGLAKLDQITLNNVMQYSSFDYMRNLLSKGDFYKKYLQGSSSGQEEKPKAGSYPEMIRKGKIGDWRNHFSEDQSRRMDEKFNAKMKNLKFTFGWMEDMLYKQRN